MQMYTIGQVAKKYGLSRSTLIYYDSIGLLSPSGRSESNYRLYSAGDLEKMDRITLFRSAGLALEAIIPLLEKAGGDLETALERRLVTINGEIQALRNQQKVILQVLKADESERNTRIITKETWVGLLEAAGLDEQGQAAWHTEFERTSPEGHQDFLESLGMDGDEIDRIRRWSRDGRDQ